MGEKEGEIKDTKGELTEERVREIVREELYGDEPRDLSSTLGVMKSALRLGLTVRRSKLLSDPQVVSQEDALHPFREDSCYGSGRGDREPNHPVSIGERRVDLLHYIRQVLFQLLLYPVKVGRHLFASKSEGHFVASIRRLRRLLYKGEKTTSTNRQKGGPQDRS